MMTQKLYEIISRVMNVPISNISDESSTESIETWDSLTMYLLLDEIESEYKIKFSLDEIVNIKTVKDLKKYLQDHGVNLND